MANMPLIIGTCSGFPINISTLEELEGEVGLHYRIRVADPNTGQFQAIELSRELFKDVEDAAMLAIRGSNRKISLFTATLITVRTNTLCNFINDFFLPTVVNHAIKIDNQITKYFAIVIALTLDIITFPIRCVTLIPRITINAYQQAPPLRQSLISAGINQQFLSKPHIRLNLSAFTPTSLKSCPDDPNNSKPFYFGKQMRINFIEVPSYKGFRLKYDFSYIRLDEIPSKSNVK
jgi:hypothetical protein